ncbi:VENN motif pre-toxin domain-containing protein [Cronobacter malonaticus]
MTLAEVNSIGSGATPPGDFSGAIAGAAGASIGEMTAKLALDLYGKKPEQLGEDERQLVSALSSVAAGIAGAAVSDNTASVQTAAQAGKNAVENNAISDIVENQLSGMTQAEKYAKAQNSLIQTVKEYKSKLCMGISDEACSKKLDVHRDELLKSFTEAGLDFVPVIGTIKSFKEADDAIDYLTALISLIPKAGFVAGKSLKAARNALKNGDIAEATKLIHETSDKVSIVKPLDVDSFKRLKSKEVVGEGLEHDHIPSMGALRRTEEIKLRRKLTPVDDKAIYQNATAVEVPEDMHRSGPTYGGKNTKDQIETDALDLCSAVCRDTTTLRGNMVERGYDPIVVDEVINKIIIRSKRLGVVK